MAGKCTKLAQILECFVTYLVIEWICDRAFASERISLAVV